MYIVKNKSTGKGIIEANYYIPQQSRFAKDITSKRFSYLPDAQDEFFAERKNPCNKSVELLKAIPVNDDGSYNFGGEFWFVSIDGEI